MNNLKVLSLQTFKTEKGSDDPYIGSGRDGQGLNLPRSVPSVPHDVGNEEFNTPDRESEQVWNLDENPNEYATMLTEYYELPDFSDSPTRASVDESALDDTLVPIDENTSRGPLFTQASSRLRTLARKGIWRYKSEDPNWRSQENLIDPYMVNFWTDKPSEFSPQPEEEHHLNPDEVENLDILNLSITEQSSVVTAGPYSQPLIPVALKWLQKDVTTTLLMALGTTIINGNQLQITKVKNTGTYRDKKYPLETVQMAVEAELTKGGKVVKKFFEKGDYADCCLRITKAASRVR